MGDGQVAADVLRSAISRNRCAAGGTVEAGGVSLVWVTHEEVHQTSDIPPGGASEPRRVSHRLAKRDLGLVHLRPHPWGWQDRVRVERKVLLATRPV